MASAVKTAAARRHDIDYEDPDTLKEAEAVLGDEAEAWLNTEHVFLWLKKPVDLIGTEHEELVRNQLRAIKYGAFS